MKDRKAQAAKQALKSAKSCRQYAMCKIDFLGTGVCASGVENGFVSHYPQGRMSLYAALAQEVVPVTKKAIEVADGCTLCGKCDHQCHFVTGMRPTLVMKALKQLVAEHLAAGKEVQVPVEDRILTRMRAIVGRWWAENDPAVGVAYSTDPCPLALPKIPRYVVMPGSRDEVCALMHLFQEEKIPWTVRGNGTNILGFALGEGVIIDLNRMKEMVFDEKRWLVRVGPGVNAFELQREAAKRGFRVNVAEPAAAVCSSIITSGILSLFSTTYGTCGNNVIDAEFVAPDGRSYRLNEKYAPNHFGFERADQKSPGVCTWAEVKLHPVTDDEKGVLVPFKTLAPALSFARECAQRRIGIGIGILGAEYVSSFISPTEDLAASVKRILKEKLEMEYLVLVMGDRYALSSVEKMGHPLIGQKLFTAINLGLPALGSARWLDLLTELSQDEPFSYLKINGFSDLAETALAPSAERLVAEVDPELRPFMQALYERPEMTDLVWLNMFRVTSSRIGREKHFFPILVYLPMELELVEALIGHFREIAGRHGLKNELGFITPVDGGKRCIFEYDYFLDQTDIREIAAMQEAAQEVGRVIEEYTARTGTIRWLRYLLYQGFCRMENLLYA